MVVLSTDRLGARFGSRQVLRDVTLPPCHGGEVVAVIGPNAAGKSTLSAALPPSCRARANAGLRACAIRSCYRLYAPGPDG